MLLRLYTDAANRWADVRTKASQEEGVTALEIGLFVGLLVFIIVIAVAVLGAKSTYSLVDLNVSYP